MGVYPNFWALPLSVQDGSLDMLLTKPLNTQFLVTLRRLDFGMPLPDVLCGLALIVYGWQREGLPVTFANLAGFVVFCIAGWFLTYCLFLIPELLSFWFVAAGGAQALSSAVFDFNNTPMNLYPKWLQRVGIFLVPVFLITNFPTLFVMGGALPRPDRLGAGRALAGVRPAAADLAAGDAPVHQRQRLSGGRSQFYCGGFCNGYDHGVQHL